MKSQPIDQLVKFLNAHNIADLLDEDQLEQIGKDVITGYKIDDDTRQEWLDVNTKAMELIKNSDVLLNKVTKNFPFDGASQIIFPLLGPAVIQMAARLDQHVVRNGRVAECKVIGKDTPMPDLQTGKPSYQGVKQGIAKRVSDRLSYELITESDTWLIDQNKQNQIVCSWGTGFKQIGFDPITQMNSSELLNPEDVIINHNISCLEKAPRITLRRYLTKNDIVQKQRQGEFSDLNLDLLKVPTSPDNMLMENDSQELNPIYEFLEQYCYMDLDGDGYDEPYCVAVHNQSQSVWGIYPAFELKDVKVDPNTGTILGIKMQHNIVDQHCIADPQGKFYSLGLNALLVHINLAINTILAQLIDSGTLRNAASCTGFITKAMQTQVRNMKVKLGQFNVLDLPPTARIQDQLMNLPFAEPSQVLLGLLQLLIDAGMKVGFMSDILTGQTETQNTPATTMLAAVEQGTRAFKPVVQNLQQALKRELKLRCVQHYKHLDIEKYAQFCGLPVQVVANDFNQDSIDVVPVADPTMSSEAHKYSRLQLLYQLAGSPLGHAMNPQATLDLIYKEVEFPNPEAMIQQPQEPPPDPKLLDVQLKDKALTHSMTIDHLQEQVRFLKLQIEQYKAETIRMDTLGSLQDNTVHNAKLHADVYKDLANTAIGTQNAINAKNKIEVERERTQILAKQSRGPRNT